MKVSVSGTYKNFIDLYNQLKNSNSGFDIMLAYNIKHKIIYEQTNRRNYIYNLVDYISELK